LAAAVWEPDEAWESSWVGLSKYVPLAPTDDHPNRNNALGFHRSIALVRIIVGANRSSKTESAMADLAALAKGAPFPEWFGWENDPAPPLTIWLAIKQFPANPRAEACFKKLYFGERKLIDGEWKWCEPFIPPEAIAENPGGDYRNVTLKNGTTIIVKSKLQAVLAMASDNADAIFIDEPTENDKWSEFVSRVLASPIARIVHVLTDAYLSTEYLDRLLDDDDDELLPDDVERFDFTTDGNPHVDPKRTEKVSRLRTRDERRVREMGMRKKDTLLCYPKVFRWLDESTGRTINRRDGTTGNWIRPFKIPYDWTRYVIHDPGVSHPAAAVWFAVQPQSKDIYAYRCCHIREPGGNVQRVCDLINRANDGDEIFAWYMDPKAGRYTDRSYTHASKESTIEVYQRVSEEFNIKWILGPPHLERARRDARINVLTSYLDPQNKAFPMMYLFDVQDGLDPKNGVRGMDALKGEFRNYRMDEKTRVPIPLHDDGIYCCEAAAAMELKDRGVKTAGGWDRMIVRTDPLEAFFLGDKAMNWREQP
jgi:hypothetical protein